MTELELRNKIAKLEKNISIVDDAEVLAVMKENLKDAKEKLAALQGSTPSTASSGVSSELEKLYAQRETFTRGLSSDDPLVAEASKRSLRKVNARIAELEGASPAPAPSRTPAKRGRMPKAEQPEIPVTPARRGRPAKSKTATPAPARRGRPAKSKTATPAPARRGRPAKSETPAGEKPKIKRGRKPKAPSETPAKTTARRGRPALPQGARSQEVSIESITKLAGAVIDFCVENGIKNPTLTDVHGILSILDKGKVLKYAKGGKISRSGKYLSKWQIKQILTDGGMKIGSDEILSGVWLKKKDSGVAQMRMGGEVGYFVIDDDILDSGKSVMLGTRRISAKNKKFQGVFMGKMVGGVMKVYDYDDEMWKAVNPNEWQQAYAEGGGVDYFSNFDFNKKGNLEAKINGKKYEIIYRDLDAKGLSDNVYELFENGKMIKSDKNVRNLMIFEGNKYAEGGGVGDTFSMSKMIMDNGKFIEMVIAENVSVAEFEKLFSDKGYEKRFDVTLVGFHFANPNGDTYQLIPRFHKRGEIISYAEGGGVGEFVVEIYSTNFENTLISKKNFKTEKAAIRYAYSVDDLNDDGFYFNIYGLDKNGKTLIRAFGLEEADEDLIKQNPKYKNCISWKLDMRVASYPNNKTIFSKTFSRLDKALELGISLENESLSATINNLDYTTFVYANNYAKGGGVGIPNAAWFVFQEKFPEAFEYYLKNNEYGVSKGDLMAMAYESTRNVDSAIPMELRKQVDDTMFYVYDYQNSSFGELVDLREKIKTSEVPVALSFVIDNEVFYGRNLPNELKNADFATALMYVYANRNVIDEFQIRPKRNVDNYAKGGGVGNAESSGVGKRKLYKLKYWETEEDMDMGESEIYDYYSNKDDAIDRAKKYQSRNDWFAVEVSDENDNVVYENNFGEYAKGGGVGGNTITDLKDFDPNTTEIIDGDANFGMFPNITDLGVLSEIRGDADFFDSQVEDLGNLQIIRGDANFTDSILEGLGELHTIGGRAEFANSQIRYFRRLRTIGGNANFQDSQVEDLGTLQEIGGNVSFGFSQVENLGDLVLIGGFAEFTDSEVQDLGNLQFIGEDADFSHSQVRYLGNLEKIGGTAYFNDSQIRSLGNLQTIGGDVFWGERTDLQNEWEMPQGNRMASGGGVENFTLADYKENEETNNHSENALMLVKMYGTQDEIFEVERLIKKGEREGGFSMVDYRRMYEISNKYYKHLVEASKRK